MFQELTVTPIPRKSLFQAWTSAYVDLLFTTSKTCLKFESRILAGKTHLSVGLVDVRLGELYFEFADLYFSARNFNEISTKFRENPPER